MKDAEFKKGQLYRLMRPDPVSQVTIREGHGYLWLGEFAGTLNGRAAGGACFKSLATGTVTYFHYDEMEQEG
jgi:hypothetical protein